VQIIPDRLPKVENGKPRQEMSGGVVAVANVAPQSPPQITATTPAKVTPQPPQISVTTLATPPSTSLTVEEMRMGGALAGARQKAKLAQNKRL
jgi:hypothetical protein